MSLARVGETEIYYEVDGFGEPLILITGMGGLASYWAPQVEAFAKHFRVYRFDHRGTGQSTHSDIAYSIEILALDTIEFMAALGIPRAHFVGHSTGGMMLQVISSQHPEIVASQVLYGTRGRTDAFSRRAMGLRKEAALHIGIESYIRSSPIFLYPSAWVHEHDAELTQAERRAVASSAPAKIIASRLDAVLRHDQMHALGKIAAPTLVTCARDDFLTPPYYSEELAAAIPNASLQFISQGGHACSITNAPEFNDRILTFLRQQSGIV